VVRVLAALLHVKAATKKETYGTQQFWANPL
jgi:hypothetical protein